MELSIETDCKADYINQISEYYTSLLTEFYRMNSRVELGEDSEGLQPQKTDSLLSPLLENRKIKQKRSFKNRIEEKITQSPSIGEDSTEKTIFEKALCELRNIEYCLNFFLDIAERNTKAVTFSQVHDKFRKSSPVHSPQRFSMKYSTYNSPMITKNVMQVDKFIPWGVKSDDSEPKPKSALKSSSSPDKRRVSFSEK